MIRLFVKLFMLLYGVKRRQRSKSPVFKPFPNEGQHPVETYELT